MGIGHRQAEYAAESNNIQAVDRTGWITGLELKLEYSADTAHCRASNEAYAGQGAGRIGDAVNCISPNAALFGKDDNVNVNFAAIPIVEHEIPLRSVLCGRLAIATRCQELPEHGDILRLHGDIKIIVRARLVSNNRIHRPAAVNPDNDAGTI